MRYLIVADIHSNLEAFQAVLQDVARRGGFESVLCLGDIVGYGPDPGPTIDLLRSLPHAAIVGNHDLAALGAVGLEDFNPYAAEAARWTTSQLSPDHREYLGSLSPQLEQREVTLVHGSPLDPVWDYFLPDYMPPQALRESFTRFKTPLCLVGHSHIPFICLETDLSFRILPEGEAVNLGPERLVLNPGGVGQPRDGDPRPSYAVYDNEAETICRFRVSYDIGVTQGKMRREGLPEYLAERLSRGR